MTSAYTDLDTAVVTSDVYVPQEDSQFLIDVMEKTGLARGNRVADLCTGTGIVAIAAREQGASQVTAFDICPRAVHCARTDAAAAGFDVSVHLGSWARAVEFGPYDLVVRNPPYVPHDPSVDAAQVPPYIGPARAWDAGYDGRLVFDPLCATAPQLLASASTGHGTHPEIGYTTCDRFSDRRGVPTRPPTTHMPRRALNDSRYIATLCTVPFSWRIRHHPPKRWIRHAEWDPTAAAYISGSQIACHLTIP